MALGSHLKAQQPGSAVAIMSYPDVLPVHILIDPWGEAAWNWGRAQKKKVFTCRMRGMMPTVEMVTFERLRPNSAGLIMVRVAVLTCS